MELQAIFQLKFIGLKLKLKEVFFKEEIKILDRVVIKYVTNGKQLEDLTHGEAPYIGTEPNKEIVYELAYYRGTDFTENA